ncbi:MAG: hypothetical protein JJU13_02205 [Balneolaceae bacterium]|nr:hypothetical protein [Balneolaceae bacterium]
MKNSVLAVSLILFMFTIACSSDTERTQSTTAQSDQSSQTITHDMIESAQEVWIQQLVRIGEAHSEGEDAKQVAEDVLNTYYDFDNNRVLFKPTLAHGDQTFRPDFDGALAYFVGGNDDYPDDSGFALAPYVSGTTDISEVYIHGDIAIAQGNITLTAYDESTVTVDKTFAYRLDNEGNLRIITHHSSLPFSP